jgi:co-chaperonin GroES (HSP10)
LKNFINLKRKKENMSKVKQCSPCGYQVLLELLSAQEMLGTKIILNEASKTMRDFQAIVLAVGPMLKEDYGFKVGDRVLLSGTGVPVPNYDDSERDKVLMEPQSIRAVLS